MAGNPLQLAEHSLRQALSSLGLEEPKTVEFQTNPLQGHVSTNIAMQSFTRDKSKSELQSPRALATALVEKVTIELSDVFSTIEVAGPGFINFYFSEHYLLEEILGASQLRIHNIPGIFQAKKVIVEFTDPNPFKEFHIGHLYSNIVGEAICRLLEATGAQVQRVCYQGDVGMHVAKSVWGLRKLLADEGQTLESLAHEPVAARVKRLGKAYALGATKFEEDESVATQIKQINFMTFLSAQENLQETIGWEPQVDYRSLLQEAGLDYAEIKQLYQVGREWSLEYFNSMYQRAGMQFNDFYFESIVGEFGLKIVREYLEKGIFRESQGAVIFPGSEYGLHDRVFINSLGLPTYEAKELGLAPEKYRRFPYDHSIIITGNEINEYFKVLLTALKQIRPELAEKTRHMSHGMVRLPEGKMSSRTGKILTGEWLMDEAHQRIAQILEENKPEMPVEQRAETAEKIGLGAIKYAFLKQSIGKDIAFSFEESLAFQGNSGPYLQYTAVRAQSILAKAEVSSNQPSDPLLYRLSDIEKKVAHHLWRYEFVVATAASEAAPHHIATYLYQLAQDFNAFYTQHQVLGEIDANARAVRLKLVQAVSHTLEHGLKLLGIETVTEM